MSNQSELGYCLARGFDYSKKSGACFGGVDSFLFDKMKGNLHRAGAGVVGKRIFSILQKVLADLCVAYMQNSELWLRIGRSCHHYKKGTYEHKMGFQHHHVCAVIDELLRLDIIEMKPGIYFPEDKIAYRTVIRLTRYGVDVLMDCFDVFSVNRHNEYLCIRNYYKQNVDIKKFPNSGTAKRKIKSYNDFLGSHSICLQEDSKCFFDSRDLLPDYTRKGLFRVYNNSSLQYGGRWFGHWLQDINKDVRLYAVIDGEPVAEVDFVGLHTNMLYAENCGYVVHDPYVLNTVKQHKRDVVKAVMVVIFNAKTRQTVAGAAAKLLNKKGVLYEYDELFEVIDAVVDTHKDIGDYFFTKCGLRLQNKDSNMMRDILYACQQQGVPVVPVHDSLVAPKSHSSFVRRVMADMSERHFGISLPTKKNFLTKCK